MSEISSFASIVFKFYAPELLALKYAAITDAFVAREMRMMRWLSRSGRDIASIRQLAMMRHRRHVYR